MLNIKRGLPIRFRSAALLNPSLNPILAFRSRTARVRIPGIGQPVESSPLFRHLRVCLILLLLISACGSLPEDRWSHLKDLRLRLLSEQADRLIPDDFSDFERHFADVREDFVTLQNRSPFLRSGRRIAALGDAIRGLNRTAEALITEVRGVRNKRLEGLRLETSLLENVLSTTGPKPFVPVSRTEMRSIRLQLARLRLLIEQGDDRSAKAVLDVLKASSLEIRGQLKELEERFSDPRLLKTWRQLCDRALERSIQTTRPVLVIDKYRRRALLLRKGITERRFVVDLGWNGLNKKRSQGDGATPEGEYVITKKKAGEHTRFHLALLLSYPNDDDRETFQRAVRRGELPRDSLIGSMIEIHGAGGRGQDWTDGCIALSNRGIELLYREAYVGMPVFIVGKCQSLR